MKTLVVLITSVCLVSISCSAFPSNFECPVYESDEIYPNCTCRHKNFDYSITLNKCFRVCPENSDGYWPKCECHSGCYFDKESFRCITCPADSTGQYPNCSCNDDDAPYNHIRNNCEKCTGGSNGKFPNCTCPNKATYEKKRGLCVDGCVWANNGNGSMEGDYCMSCPTIPDNPIIAYRSIIPIAIPIIPDDSAIPIIATGNYPNCICKDKRAGYDVLRNRCINCPSFSTGIYPNCNCEDGGTYNVTRNDCKTCPYDSTGVYPRCVCEDPGSVFIMHLNICYSCPPGSTGDYPNCKCDNAYFSEELNRCIECPIDATGVYPTCECHDVNLTFSAFINQCYLQCPDNSSGIQPDCQCDAENFYYDANDKACKKQYQCPDNSSGIHPNCRCDVEYFYYDANDKACKSNIGRMCPANSIGIGPDCLCMSQYHRFDLSSWSCVTKYFVFTYASPISTSCPDNNGKWPQCDSLIDFNVLRSCVG